MGLFHKGPELIPLLRHFGAACPAPALAEVTWGTLLSPVPHDAELSTVTGTQKLKNAEKKKRLKI